MIIQRKYSKNYLDVIHKKIYVQNIEYTDIVILIMPLNYDNADKMLQNLLMHCKKSYLTDVFFPCIM